MKQRTDFTLPKNVDWFKHWFDSAHYHKLYSNRNEQEAADFIDHIIDWLQPAPGSRMLDLACGAGRHSKRLASKGYHVTGIDLASASIREAKESETGALNFMRHDMRDPFGFNQFDYMFNLFTSFGYFKTQFENEKVIKNMSCALKNGGKLVFDYLNTRYAEERLVPFEEKEVDDIHYHITRWMDDKFFYKKIVIDESEAGEPFENVEQVARFSLSDFKRMFAANGLYIEDVFGDYGLSSFEPELSPRLIIVFGFEI